jgi:diacylglycerol kinase family enzyme
LTDEDSEKILILLNEDSIEQIDLIDKLSDWIFCNPFSGGIILTVDKRTEMKLHKLKL